MPPDTDTTQDAQPADQSANADSSADTSGQDPGATGYRSQEDFDRAFARKLEKERTKLRDEMKREADEAAKQAKMDDAQKATAAKEKAEAEAAAKVKAADSRIIRSEAKLAALDEGANPKRVEAILKLTDLSVVEIGDDGEPDSEALVAAVKATLDAYPEFKTAQAAGSVGGGTNPAGGSTANSTEKNPWSKEHRNLTEQARVMRENPALAKKLMEAAN